MKTLIFAVILSALMFNAFADSAAGQEKVESERCSECHGLTGHGASPSNGVDGKFAKLAGQRVNYIMKQIQDFRSGARKHDQMQIMARSITDEDARDIAAYFSSQSAMQGEANTKHGIGLALYERGDANRGIVACQTCHGAAGRGIAGDPLTPVVGGQEWRYLDKQLRDWRSGERRNSSGGIMNLVTRQLTDAEIESLAYYLSGIQ